MHILYTITYDFSFILLSLLVFAFSGRLLALLSLFFVYELTFELNIMVKIYEYEYNKGRGGVLLCHIFFEEKEIKGVIIITTNFIYKMSRVIWLSSSVSTR